jgi:hypothetical protein
LLHRPHSPTRFHHHPRLRMGLAFSKKCSKPVSFHRQRKGSAFSKKHSTLGFFLRYCLGKDLAFSKRVARQEFSQSEHLVSYLLAKQGSSKRVSSGSYGD